MAGITAPVSLSKIREKFGGTGPLSDYRRGGGLVPDIPANANISTTAAGLSIAQFLGADVSAGSTATFPTSSLIRSRVDNGAGLECRAEARFNADGNAYRYTNQNGLQTIGAWLLTGAASDFEIYCTHEGTPLSLGTLNTWLDMGTTRTWRLATSTNDRSYDATLTFQIRRKSDGVIVATGSYTLEVQKGLK